jgi:LAS superfamily LD-carboxypeptidase LdcB
VNALELTGRARTHVVELGSTSAMAPRCGTPPLSATLHKYAVAPFLALCRAARAAGFELQAVSSFRDFDRQLGIWNAKYQGERALLDAAGLPLDAKRLTSAERIDAILGWSALPGASRHHWGTDLDVIDSRAIPANYTVRLIPAEFAPGGPFAALSAWLEGHAARFGFFQPFRGALSGVRAEPWHYSFAPEAERARRALTPAVLGAALESAPLMGKEVILAQLESLHARYVAAIDWP